MPSFLTMIKKRQLFEKVFHICSNPYINEKYPTGTGLPGGFYIRYHSYAHIYPLLTLAHYAKYRK